MTRVPRWQWKPIQPLRIRRTLENRCPHDVKEEFWKVDALIVLCQKSDNDRLIFSKHTVFLQDVELRSTVRMNLFGRCWSLLPEVFESLGVGARACLALRREVGPDPGC